MTLEVGTRIADLVATNPVGATDFVSQGDDHIRLIKACLQGSLPNLGPDAVTASALELNILDGATLSTAELNFVDGVTSGVQAQLDAKLSIAAAASGYQPLDSDLTAIAALTTTSFGRGFLDLADLAALATKINALVPSWSGAHAFAQNITSAAPTSGRNIVATQAAGTSLDAIRVASAAGAGNVASINWLATGVQEWRITVNTTGGALNIRDETRGANPVSIATAGNITIAAPTTGVALTLTGSSTAYEALLQHSSTDATPSNVSAPNVSLDNTSNTDGNYSAIMFRGTDNAAVIRYGAMFGVKYSGRGASGPDTTFQWYVRNAAGTITLGKTIDQDGVNKVNDAGTLREVGFRGLHRRDFSSSDNYAASDNGKCVRYTGSGGHTFTIDSDFAADSMLTIINASSVNLTIAESLSGGMFWMNGGAGGSGSRTLAGNGVCTIHGISGTDAYIWGNGLT